MQFRIFPVHPVSVAAKSWAVKMQVARRVFGDANVPPKKEMSALGADAHFIKGPPFLEWISLPEKVQFTAIGLKESHASSIPTWRGFVRREML